MNKKLTIEEKICQKLIIGCNSSNVDLIVEMIENYAVGGVILYKKNYSSYEEMVNVINKLKKANRKNKIPLFISIDQEGGRVNRLPSSFERLLNVYDMSKKDKKLIYKNGFITGEILSSLGINMNFAPVIDIYNDSSKALYKRCFYEDVSDCGIEYIKGLKKHNVIASPKHFPGHGISRIDSHLIVPYIFNNKLIDKHMKPFEDVISFGIDSLMVGHLMIRGMTGFVSASISNNFIKKYIREKYNYNGLIITDEIGMISRNGLFLSNILKRAILSDGDLVLIKVNKKNIKIIDKVISYVSKSNNLDVIDKSVERILSVKEKYNINDNIVNKDIDINKINKEIEKINKMSL